MLSREDKYHVPSEHVAHYRAYGLQGIYLLSAAEGMEPLQIEQLRGAEAVQTLMSHTFRGQIVPYMAATERHFRSCLALLQQCRVYRLQRPWGLDGIDAVCDAIAQHIRQ